MFGITCRNMGKGLCTGAWLTWAATSLHSGRVTSHESCVIGFPWEVLGSCTTVVSSLSVPLFWLLYPFFSHLDMYPLLYSRSSGTMLSHVSGMFNVLSDFFNDILFVAGVILETGSLLPPKSLCT